MRRAVSLLVLAATGCAALKEAQRPDPVDELLARARSAGLPLDSPYQLDPVSEGEVRNGVGLIGTTRERLSRVARFVNDGAFLGFDYAPHHTLTAKQAFHSRKGDCMAYANLLTAAARAVGLSTQFVLLQGRLRYFEQNGTLYADSHIAVSVATADGRVIIDFGEPIRSWRQLLFEPLEDADAVALHYSNVAMEKWLPENPARAEKTLRFLVAERPKLKELRGNLGAILLRQGRNDEALAVLEEALAQFPEHSPLYTNAALAARRKGDPERAERVLEQGRAVAAKDPFFRFAHGLDRYQQGDFRVAADDFEEALKTRPQSALLEVWLIRARMESGQQLAARVTLEQLRGREPAHPLLEELERAYPVLRAQ